jgi:hypothetical protein
MQASKTWRAQLTLILCLLLNIVPAPCWANGAGSSIEHYRKPYTFTENWFTHKTASWSEILKEFKGKPDVNYLEIGTFEGRSALWVLENIATHPTAKLTIVDAFQEDTLRTFTSNINLSGEASKFKIISGYSTEKIKDVPSNSIDFAYIDGSGKGIVMMSDLVNTWNSLKPNGIIIFSRYELDSELRRALELQPADPGPVEAIDAFLKLYRPYIKVLLFEENQVVFRKIRQ